MESILVALRGVVAAVRGWINGQVLGAAALSILWIEGVARLVVGCKKRRREKRERRASEERRAQFVLPDRDNTFVQSRLHTALQPNAEESADEAREETRVEHARKLLVRLKNAPLSVAERLQAEDMERTLRLCLAKERWSATDVRLMSDTFAAVLKLAAKYAV